MPIITKQYKFCAAHRYWNEEWSPDKNQDIFGDDIKIHGHNYLLDITISGPVNPDSGFIINLKELNAAVKTQIIEIFDHNQIEKDIPWFQDRQPSTENIVVFIWEQLADKINYPANLHAVKLQETPTISTTYFGPDKKYDR